MSMKHFLATSMVVCLALSSYGPCMGQDQKPVLVVEKIVFARAERAKEKITLMCNQVCSPEVSALEGDRPRIVMDLNGVASMEKKDRAVRQSGKFVKKIRSYLDEKAGKLRIVLDMDASINYLVSPVLNPPVNTFSLSISKQPSARQGYAGKSPISKPRRILIAGRDEGVDAALSIKAGKRERSGKTGVAPNELSVDRGRSLMDAGDYDGAINIFTRIIEKNQKNSLCYRLRGNAYAGIGDRPKAIDDWIIAARLGDQTIQAYLDFLKVPWQEKSKP